MSKILYVGDVHFKHTQKEECERLMNFVLDSADANNVDQIVLLGDLNDTFGILRTDNLDFWSKWLRLLSAQTKLYVLVGNHDKRNQGNDNEPENSLDIFNLIDSPTLFIIKHPVTAGIFGYMPYIHNKELFKESAAVLADQGAKVLVCHGEFDGGAYDNGFFIKDGIKPEELPFNLVISGHIHTRSTIGKVRHPGSPRWMTSSDANKEKGIWLVNHDDSTGAILKEQFLDTSSVCTPIYAYEFKEGDNYPEIPEGSRVSIELIGSSEWVLKQKAKFKGRASVSVKITDRQKSQNRKSGNSLEYFVNNIFESSIGLKKERMIEFMREVGVL